MLLGTSLVCNHDEGCGQHQGAFAVHYKAGSWLPKQGRANRRLTALEPLTEVVSSARPGSQTGSRSEGAESRVGTATSTSTSTATHAYCVSGIARTFIRRDVRLMHRLAIEGFNASTTVLLRLKVQDQVCAS